MTDDTPSGGISFFNSFVTVRRLVLRGNIRDAEDFIDHHYSATHPHALMLEWVIHEFRSNADSDTAGSRSVRNCDSAEEWFQGVRLTQKN